MSCFRIACNVLIFVLTMDERSATVFVASGCDFQRSQAHNRRVVPFSSMSVERFGSVCDSQGLELPVSVNQIVGILEIRPRQLYDHCMLLSDAERSLVHYWADLFSGNLQDFYCFSVINAVRLPAPEPLYVFKECRNTTFFKTLEDGYRDTLLASLPAEFAVDWLDRRAVSNVVLIRPSAISNLVSL